MQIIKVAHYLIFLLVVSVTPLLGVVPYQPKIVNPLTQSWRWKLFPELEGKGIRDIFEEDDKTVWVAFNEGILEYNGYEWKTHNHTNGLPDSPVEFVLVDEAGKVYAATDDGIYTLQGQQWIPELTGLASFNGLKELEPGLIAAPFDQGLVVLSRTHGVKVITSQEQANNLKSAKRPINYSGLPNELIQTDTPTEISDIILDHDDRIWIALTMPDEKGRLISFPKNELFNSEIEHYQIYSPDKKKRFGESQKLLEAQDGAIWVINSTYKTGISIWRDGDWEYLNLSDQFSGDEYMTDIVETDDGTIWIGALGKLYAYKNEQWSIYTAPDYPIPANRLVLHASKGNYLWVAGYKSKVYFLDFSFDTWISYQGLNFQFEDADHTTWFLDIDGQVVLQEGVKWSAYNTADGLMDAPVRLMHTSKGQIWAAGSHQGVAATALLNGDRWERYIHPELSWGIDYRAIFEDQNGALWIGGAVDAESNKGQKSGVMKLVAPLESSKNWVHYPATERRLFQSNVYGIGQSTDGRIWIGGGNLYGFDGTSWQKHVDSRLQQFVNIVCSKDGLLAAGSRYYGVFLFDGQEWKNYDNATGLSGNTVISIDIIAPNHIYVATENDICRFDGQNWVNNVFPEEMNMEFEGGTILHDNAGAVWINKSDRSWKRRAFPYNKSGKGTKPCFITHKYVPDDTPPETKITMYSAEVSQAGNTLITWDGNDYYAQSANKDLMFSYRIDEGTWSSFVRENAFTFTGLKSGQHKLEVRARDLDLNIDPTPETILFRVLPPVWKQTWFIILMLAFALIVGTYEYRVITKKRKLVMLNNSLHRVNEKLLSKSQKIELQNEEILQQQTQLLQQSQVLEIANKNLEERNSEIRNQKEQLEELIVQIEELSKAKLSFFTNISHELRTPLTLISGPINQLIEQGQSLSEASRQKLLHIIDRNSDRLLKLINQLLELRRIEKSSMEPNYVNINLTDYINQVVGMFENLAIEKDIQLDYARLTELPTIQTDPDKVEKIIVNLLSNAFKHTREGEHIRIQVDQVNAKEVAITTPHEHLIEICIEDTGCGIRPHDLEHIYQRFFSSDTQDLQPNSSGIGLAYTRELVELLEGKIQVESELGIGTTFRIYLPYLPVSEAASKDETEAVVPLPQIVQKEVSSLIKNLKKDTEIMDTVDNSTKSLQRILVVEDQPDMQLFIEAILQDEYLVIKANHGKEGLKIANDHNIDLIISDIMMPEMDGLTFCKTIKETAATSHIPVLLLTAKTLDESRIKGYQEGADAYITKPFNRNMLRIRVNNLLEQRANLREAFNRDFMLTPEKVQLNSPDDILLSRIVDIMEEHLDDSNFNVNQMCKMVHLSHMHFIRKVKQLTGKKPIDLLKSFRMKRAKDLLLQNKRSISEVAYQVGYDLPNSFSRAFKKEFGLSPKQFIDQQETIEENS